MRKPKLTYIPAFIVLLFNMVLWMTGQFITSDSRWREIVESWPMSFIWLGTICFLIGLFVQDLYNQNSWVMENWRVINKLFKVVTLHVGHIEDEPEHLSVILLIKYIREIKNGLITITVIPQNSEKKSNPFITHHEENINCPSHRDRRITICSLRVPRPNKPAIHSVWGEEVGSVDILDGQKTITPGSSNLVIVEVKNKFRKQRFEFMIDFKSPTAVSSPDLPYIHLMRFDEVANVYK